MAYRADRMDLNQKSIFITILLHGDEVEEISARLALRPEALSRAAVESHLTRLNRLLQSLLIHETQHQHHTGIGVLYDCRNQAAALLKIQN